MSYQEIIVKALKGKSVNAVAKDWELQQVTLNRYVRGERLPDYTTAKRIAEEAGIPYGEMLELLAQEEKSRKEKLSYNATPVGALAQLVEQRTLNP